IFCIERDILEKDLQIKRLEEASILLVRQVDLFQKSFEEEKQRRQKAEEEILNRVKQLTSQLNEDLTSTSAQISGELKRLKSELSDYAAHHTEARESLSQRVEDETSKLNQALEEERKEREKNEESIINTVEKVFGGFQEGLAVYKS
ncbi:MAG: hypothetical protein EZS28_027077, partial [Streblomastix strix]